MKVLRVFNNNVVMASDDLGREVVLTGRGLGFGAKPGQGVDPAAVVRTFVPDDGSNAAELAQLVAQIPPEHVALASDALALARAELDPGLSASVVVPLADHLSFAIKRVRQDIAVEYPLRVEVAHLYPRELATAERIVELVNRQLAAPLPVEEAVPVALHLVNAGFASGDLSRTYQMTTVLAQIFDVIDSAYDRRLDRSGVNAARFVSHLRYFFVRMDAGAQFGDSTTLLDAVRSAYPRAHACAIKVQAVLELRLGQPINADEVAYLTLHVARLTDHSEPLSTKGNP